MSDTLLLDTNIASDLLKRRPQAELYESVIRGKRLALSFASVAELYRWAVKRQWSRSKIDGLEAAIQRYVVAAYDSQLAWEWAKVVTACEVHPATPIAPMDAWIAATALRHQLALFTSNLRHFAAVEQRCGLKLIRLAEQPN